MSRATEYVEIISRFEHAFRTGDQSTFDELCDPGLVDHNPAPDHEGRVPASGVTTTTTPISS